MISVDPRMLKFIENLRLKAKSPYVLFQKDLNNKYLYDYFIVYDSLNLACKLLISRQMEIEELKIQIKQLEEENSNLLNGVNI